MNKRSNGTRVRHNKENDSRVDTTIVVIMMLFAVISIATIFSTVYLQYEGDPGLFSTIKHGVWWVAGIFIAFIIMQLDRKTLFDFAPIAYWIGIILLVVVLIFYDRDLYLSNGAKSWLGIGPITFQPSELMKFAYIMMMGRLASNYIDKSKKNNYSEMKRQARVRVDLKFLWQLILWTILPLALVILQNDLGTTLVFLIIFVGVVFTSGITYHIIVPAFLFLGLLFLGLLFLVIYDREFLLNLGFQDYQFARIDSWLDPFGDTASDSYQLAQSLKAIGSGGLTGKGFGNFEVYVPVRESDMIFATIGENFGFIGSCLVILLYFLLIFQIINIAFKTHDAFYVTAVAGIVSMLTFHIVENIGMSIGLLPLTGIPLPFLSQGGTSLLVNMMCIGFVLSIKYNANIPENALIKNPVVRLVRGINKGVNYDRFIRT